MNAILKRTVLLSCAILLLIILIYFRTNAYQINPQSENLEQLTAQLYNQDVKDPNSLGFAFQKVLDLQKKEELEPLNPFLEKIALQFPRKRAKFENILSIFSNSSTDQLLKNYLLLEIFQDNISSQFYADSTAFLLKKLKLNKQDSIDNIYNFLDRLQNNENNTELGITKSSLLNLSNTLENNPPQNSDNSALKFAYQEILKNNSNTENLDSADRKKSEAHAQIISILNNPRLEIEATVDTIRNISDPKVKKIIIERFLLKNPTLFHELMDNLPQGTFEEI